MAARPEKSLAEVVEGRLLTVADYQRPYAWEDKQLADLWDDLDLLGPGARHYAGTLVLKATGGAAEVTEDGVELLPFEVVDGQQRLTTCFILLDRVRRRLEPIDDSRARRATARIGEQYRWVEIGGVQVPRLTLAGDLGAFWKEQILGEHAIASTELIAGQRRLRDAAAFFDAQLDSLVADAPADAALARLLDAQRRVTAGLRLLVYEVESDAEVGVVFETLNDRGKPLTELEKVKNYLLYLARQLPDARQHELANQINHGWAKIFENLARGAASREETLLRAHWLATQNPDSRQWKGAASVKVQFPRSRYVPGSARLAQVAAYAENAEPGIDDATWDQLHGEVSAYVRTLVACSTFMAEIDDPTAQYHAFTSGQARVRRATAALKRSPAIALFRPVLFAMRLAHPDDGEGYADLVQLCEKYSARVFAIAQRRANAGEPYLSAIAHRLFRGTEPATCIAEIEALVWEYASDEDLRVALLGEENWYRRAAHKFFLYEYELSLVASPNDVKPFEEFVDTGKRKTTEHILPRNPEDDSDWWSAFTPEQHARLVNTLGNLALTYDNSVYGRKPYAKKRGTHGQSGCYASASLAQERQLADRYPEWTEDSVKQRQEHIAEWALIRWAVRKPNDQRVRELDEALDEEVSSTDDQVDVDNVT